MVKPVALLPALLLCLAASRPTVAATGAAETGILDRVTRTYHALRSYEISGRVLVESEVQGKQQRTEVPFTLARADSSHLREEVGDPTAGMLMISDGKQTWFYQPARRQYMRMPAPTVRRDDAAEGGSGGQTGLAVGLLSQYRTIGVNVQSVRRLRDEAVPFEGEKRECQVLEVEYRSSNPNPGIEQSPRTFWIDKERALVLRQRASLRANATVQGGPWSRTETVSFTRVRLNERPADTLFVFRVPPGATETTPSAGGPGGSVDLTGQKAIDFTLKDLDGKPTTLRSLRGKVVMLDFWATWCGPCRLEMPRLETLHRQLKSKGLVVLGLNQRESASKARAFVKQNGYTFRILLDPNAEVAARYQVIGIPTLVVVDRTGKIAAYFVGVRDEDVLREAIRKAGIR